MPGEPRRVNAGAPRPRPPTRATAPPDVELPLPISPTRSSTRRRRAGDPPRSLSRARESHSQGSPLALRRSKERPPGPGKRVSRAKDRFPHPGRALSARRRVAPRDRRLAFDRRDDDTRSLGAALQHVEHPQSKTGGRASVRRSPAPGATRSSLTRARPTSGIHPRLFDGPQSGSRISPAPLRPTQRPPPGSADSPSTGRPPPPRDRAPASSRRDVQAPISIGAPQPAGTRPTR